MLDDVNDWSALDRRLAELGRPSADRSQLVALIRTSRLRLSPEAPVSQSMACLTAPDGETVCLEYGHLRPHLWFGPRHGAALAEAGLVLDRKAPGAGRHSGLDTRDGFAGQEAFGLKSTSADEARQALAVLGLLGDLQLDGAAVDRWVEKLRRHFPGFEGFDPADPAFEDREITYKLAVTAKLTEGLAAAETAQDRVRAVHEALRSYNLLFWMVPAKLAEEWPKDRIGAAIADLAAAGPEETIPAMAAFVTAFMADAPEPSFDVARQLAGALAMHLHPERAIYFRKTVRDDLYREATHRPFPRTQEAAEVFAEELAFARAVEQALAERGLSPRSLLDVQAALWVAHNYSDDEAPTAPNLDAQPPEPEPMTRPLNTILYGPPGTGKTYLTARRAVEICDGSAPAEEEAVRSRHAELVAQKRIEFVTFHQSYGYEEFVEGLRPVTPEGGAGFSLEPVDGVLKRIALRAASRQTADARPLPHVLVIDEINRANISRVLGELITLVEEDKRTGAPNAVEVVLPHSGKPFSLPPNLHVLGTMNTADRSIALMDTALRRRFHFEEVPPDPALLAGVQVEGLDIDLAGVLTALNERLEFLLGPDHLLGHGWFMGVRNKAGLDAVMGRKVIPLLREYFHEDLGRVRAVLGGGDGFVEAHPLRPPPGMAGELIEPRWRYIDRYARDGGYAPEAWAEIAAPAAP